MRVVLTCRTRMLQLPRMKGCELPQLPLEEAVGVLRQACCDWPLGDAEAAAVAEACGFNALELQLVGGALSWGVCKAQVCRRGCRWMEGPGARHACSSQLAL